MPGREAVERDAVLRELWRKLRRARHRCGSSRLATDASSHARANWRRICVVSRHCTMQLAVADLPPTAQGARQRFEKPRGREAPAVPTPDTRRSSARRSNQSVSSWELSWRAPLMNTGGAFNVITSGPLTGPFFLSRRLFGGLDRGHRIRMKSGNARAEHALQQRDLARSTTPAAIEAAARPDACREGWPSRWNQLKLSHHRDLPPGQPYATSIRGLPGHSRRTTHKGSRHVVS